MIKLKYKKEKNEWIFNQEEKILKSYTDIINEYQDKFKKYGYFLNLNCYWLETIKNKKSDSRLSFKNGYEFYILCKALRYSNCEDAYSELSVSYNISSITGFLFFLNVKLNPDTEHIIEDLERMLKLIDKNDLF